MNLYYPKITSTRNLPVNFNSEDASYFEGEYEKKIHETYIYRLNNVYATAEGIVVKRFRIFEPSLLAKVLFSRSEWAYLLSVFVKRKRELGIDKNTYVLAFNSEYRGYFHWITETLPRLFIIKEKLIGLVLLLPEELGSFHMDSLAPFSIKKVHQIKPNKYVSILNIIMPSHTAPTGNYRDELIKEVAQYYQKYYQEKSMLNLGTRIYISRKRAKKRRIINERAVEGLFRKWNILSICLEDYCFAEQVSICLSAKYLIGIHGAGLTNMIFMPKGGKVLEFRRENGFHLNCYFSLASALDHEYYYQLGKVVNESEQPHNSDISIDLIKLEENLNLIFNTNL